MNKIVEFRLHILVSHLGPNWAICGPGNGWRRARNDFCHSPNLAGRPKLWGFQSQKVSFSEIFTNRTVWAQNRQSVGPEMGEGGPGPILVIHPILTGAQNYGDPISQMCNFRKFLLINPFGPKLGILGTRKWVKEGPDRFWSLTQSCRAPKIMGIPYLRCVIFGNFY